MKILLINNDKGWSGGQEHLKDLATDLLRQGVDVHFVVREGSKSDVRLRDLGTPVHALPGHGIGDLKAILLLAGLIRKERFDIISVNREHDLLITVIARLLAMPFRKFGKLLVTYHCGTSRRQPLLRFTDGVICVSEHVRGKLSEKNSKAAGRAHVLANGINPGLPPDETKYDPYRAKRFFIGHTFPLIGMVGAFFKNQLELVEIIPLLMCEYPDIKVALVGDEGDAGLSAPIVEKVRSLGLTDDVIITGRVPHDRMADVYFDLDISVSTFRNEGFGLVHLESLAAGTPVVAYNEGGQVDIFRDCDSGLLVNGGPEQFAEAVIGLLRDHERRFSMGREGAVLVRSSFSVEMMGRRYMELFLDMAGKGCCHPMILHVKGNTR